MRNNNFSWPKWLYDESRLGGTFGKLVLLLTHGMVCAIKPRNKISHSYSKKSNQTGFNYVKMLHLEIIGKGSTKTNII